MNVVFATVWTATYSGVRCSCGALFYSNRVLQNLQPPFSPLRTLPISLIGSRMQTLPITPVKYHGSPRLPATQQRLPVFKIRPKCRRLCRCMRPRVLLAKNTHREGKEACRDRKLRDTLERHVHLRAHTCRGRAQY